ncbi:hypothetical protein ERJ75_001714000 [Trypanosoma vivax]|nr:hypothetical protein ERJ75_001714000 [Trypanosoma vivax]
MDTALRRTASAVGQLEALAEHARRENKTEAHAADIELLRQQTHGVRAENEQLADNAHTNASSEAGAGEESSEVKAASTMETCTAGASKWDAGTQACTQVKKAPHRKTTTQANTKGLDATASRVQRAAPAAWTTAATLALHTMTAN